MKSSRPTHYQPAQNHVEMFLVVDVDREVAAVGPRFRAYMTAKDGGEDSPTAASAAAELPGFVLAWCEENVPVDCEACFAIAREVFAHDGPLPAGYSGGGIAIQVHEEPPRAVLRVLKERALACAKQVNAERRGDTPPSGKLTVLGFRVVTRRTMDTSVAV